MAPTTPPAGRPPGRAALAALAVLLCCGGGKAAGPKDGIKLIEDNKKLIIGFAYPTTKSVDSVRPVDDATDRDGSFHVTVRFNLTDSGGDPTHVTLKFKFDRNARMTGVSETNRSPSLWASFATAAPVVEAVKATIRDDDKLRGDPAWKSLLAVESPQTLLCTLINIRDGK